MERQTEKNRPRFRIAIRVLAGALALMMLFSTAMLLLTRIVQPKSGTLTEKSVQDAFAALSRDDAYLNASAAARVKMLLT